MKELAEVLNITALDIVRWCVIAVIVIAGLVAICVKLYKDLSKLHKSVVEKEEIENKRIETLENHEELIKQLVKNDKNTEKEISEIKDVLIELKNKLQDMEDQDNKSKRASYKDKIGRLYRYCHERMTITAIEKDTLIDMIKDYEDCGGYNSFIHSTVEPEIQQWTVIDDIKK